MLMISLYKGMEATFWRHWWWSGGYFGTIYAIKGALPKPTVSTLSSLTSVPPL